MLARLIVVLLLGVATGPPQTLHAQSQKLDPERSSIRDQLALARTYLGEAPDSAFFWAQKALVAAKKSGDLEGEAMAQELAGEVFYRQSAFPQSAAALLEARELWEQTDNKVALAANHNALGLVEYYTHQLDEALDLYRDAYGLYNDLGDSSGMAYTLGLIGHIYEKKGDYPEALQCQRQALGIYTKLGDSTGMGAIFENLGSIYEDQEAFPQAKAWFEKALKANLATGNRHGLLGNYNNLGDIYRKTGRYQDALTTTQKAVDLAGMLNEKYQRSSALRDLGKTYQLMGDSGKANFYYEQSYQLYQEIYTQESTRQLAIMHTLFETERMLNKIETLEKDRRLNQVIRIGSGILIFLILLLGGVIFNRQKLKNRKNQEILEQERMIHQTSQQLLEAELENHRLNEKQLGLELEARSKALTAHTLHIMRKNEMLRKLKTGLQEVYSKEKGHPRRELKRMIQEIEFSFHEDKDWEDFTRIFGQVHQQFFDALDKQHPGLSEAERRLCALLKLGLDSVEIASVLGISTDSLRVARYRLRKKLGLQKDQKLRAYIQQV